jgi:hypothetical protein
VAAFVADRLERSGFEASFFDEDWGCMARAWRPEGPLLEIAVYHDVEGDSPESRQLMVRSLRKEKLLGVVPRLREVEVEPAALDALESVFREAGIPVSRRAEE